LSDKGVLGLYWARTLLWFLLALWFLASIYLLFFGHAHSFQRAGSMGVGLVVIAFGFSKSRQTKEAEKLLSQQIEMAEIRAHVHAGGLATKVIEKTIGQQPNNLEILDNLREIDEMLVHQVSEVSNDLRAKTSKLERSLTIDSVIEIVMIVCATMQWGYGDLFHCWWNGNGWQAC